MPGRPPPYRAGVETALHGSGLPYGYTLTVWSSGAILSGVHGQPGMTSIALFAAGAALAWGTLRVLTRGASRAEGLQLAGSPHLLRAGAVHFLAIAAAISAARLAAEIDAGIAWPLASAAATATYLAITGVELAFREREVAAREGHG